MDYYDSVPYDNFDDCESNNFLFNNKKIIDRGYSKIFTFNECVYSYPKKIKITVYTSSNGSIGSHIRNAESGEYYKELVGSLDEELFFKLNMATGEVKSKNGSTTMFYNSPNDCMRHLHIEIPQNIINKWEVKNTERLRVNSIIKNKFVDLGRVIVK
jgi:hypothetical protein